jgi:hypothetical protein
MNTFRFIALALCVAAATVWQTIRLNQIHDDVLRLAANQKSITDAQKVTMDRIKDARGVTITDPTLRADLRTTEEIALAQRIEIQTDIADIKATLADMPDAAEWEQIGETLEEIRAALALIIERLPPP